MSGARSRLTPGERVAAAEVARQHLQAHGRDVDAELVDKVVEAAEALAPNTTAPEVRRTVVELLDAVAAGLEL